MKATVWVHGTDGHFGVRVDATKSLSLIQRALTKAATGSNTAGLVAGELYTASRELGINPVLVSHRDKVDYLLDLNVVSTPYDLTVQSMGGTSKVNLYKGNIANLANWSNTHVNLDGAVGKLVRFTYEGGETRVLKLDSVTPGRKGILLRGEDINKRGFRAFDVNKIEGEIEILS